MVKCTRCGADYSRPYSSIILYSHDEGTCSLKHTVYTSCPLCRAMREVYTRRGFYNGGDVK